LLFFSKGGSSWWVGPFLQIVAKFSTIKRVDALNNLTFIGFSLICFVIIFLLLRYLPRLKAKTGGRPNAPPPSGSQSQTGG
jgi:hypothetical protein